MTPAARLAAAISVLDAVLDGAPAERELTNWARASRFAGSGDRAAIRDIVFDCLRNRRSFDAVAGFGGGRGLALGWCLAGGAQVDVLFSGRGYGPGALSDAEQAAHGQAQAPDGAAAADLPDWLWPIFQTDHGNAALDLARRLCRRAPLDLRVHVARSTVPEAQAALQAEGVASEPVPGVPTALRVTENPRRVAGSAAFRKGLIEIQDAASQAVVGQLPLSSGARVLDLCAGGGGKSLAMAAAQPDARLDAWDISPARLAGLVPRAERALAQIRLLDAAPTGSAYDLVLVDAPCSGSGAWRRSPEAKWRLTPDRLEELCGLQRDVLAAGWAATRPGGTLAYATCSVLCAENQQQVAAFCSATPGARPILDQAFALDAPGDGFYLALIGKGAT